MQITNVSAYSLQQLLKKNAAGIRLVGHTVKPGYSSGLNLTDRKPVGATVGYSA
jgi:hypothetical protein